MAEAQANIDAAIEQINGLAAMHIDGRRLLDGSADFDVFGRNRSQVSDLRVYRIAGGSSPTISGTVTASATQAEIIIAADVGGRPIQADGKDGQDEITGKARGSGDFSGGPMAKGLNSGLRVYSPSIVTPCFPSSLSLWRSDSN